MYIVIVGCGRLGRRVASEFSSHGHEVVIIDRDIKNLHELRVFDGEKISGIEYDFDVLKSAGINKTDIFLALTSDDSINIMASRAAKEIFGVKRVIGRMSNLNMKYIYDFFEIDSVSEISLSVDNIKEKINY